ncbi:anti-adapter protein [Candidatus Sodalis endolongispinus]|uniref:Anti-adapter protein n=1 Tax=Candidatus Sodalis endolongispinus TaxID=2812662 RepID=A0ABS5Y896_9GAMM|nr:anti-adapter protein IraP [Candidatus Sodalis endolongispinus]MBT9431225.1 anti-adapter protein [Candidatus Sodalis endolongispinus]
MNSLLSQLLIRLAQKEAAEKELHALVQSLEILVAALISSLTPDKLNELVGSIDVAMKNLPCNLETGHSSDIELLNNNITRITAAARRH